MVDQPFESQNQTHLGWRSLPADAGDGCDQLILSEPLQEQPDTEGDTPLVKFLNSHLGSNNSQDMGHQSSYSVEDSGLEAKSLLGSNDDDAIALNPVKIKEASNPLVIFSEDARDSDQSLDTKTIFS